jgi:hypothetical protein
MFIIPSSWGSQLDGEKLSTPSRINGHLCLTAAEAAVVVFDDAADDFLVHLEWALIGKVLGLNNLHISTIASAL